MLRPGEAPSADLFQALFEARTVALIGFRVDGRNLIGLKGTDHLRRRADDQGVFRELLAARDHGTGADDAAPADPRAVQHDRAHADQRAILDRAAMQDGIVANSAVLSDRERKAGIGVAGRAVLHIRAFADLDPLIVAAHHRTEPDAGAWLQAHLADYARGLSDEIVAVGGKVGSLPVEFVDRHQGLLF